MQGFEALGSRVSPCGRQICKEGCDGVGAGQDGAGRRPRSSGEADRGSSCPTTPERCEAERGPSGRGNIPRAVLSSGDSHPSCANEPACRTKGTYAHRGHALHPGRPHENDYNDDNRDDSSDDAYEGGTSTAARAVVPAPFDPQTAPVAGRRQSAPSAPSEVLEEKLRRRNAAGAASCRLSAPAFSLSAAEDQQLLGGKNITKVGSLSSFLLNSSYSSFSASASSPSSAPSPSGNLPAASSFLSKPLAPPVLPPSVRTPAAARLLWMASQVTRLWSLTVTWSGCLVAGAATALVFGPGGWAAIAAAAAVGTATHCSANVLNAYVDFVRGVDTPEHNHTPAILAGHITAKGAWVLGALLMCLSGCIHGVVVATAWRSSSAAFPNSPTNIWPVSPPSPQAKPDWSLDASLGHPAPLPLGSRNDSAGHTASWLWPAWQDADTLGAFLLHASPVQTPGLLLAGLWCAGAVLAVAYNWVFKFAALGELAVLLAWGIIAPAYCSVAAVRSPEHTRKPAPSKRRQFCMPTTSETCSTTRVGTHAEMKIIGVAAQPYTVGCAGGHPLCEKIYAVISAAAASPC
eukprot:GHVT01006212.1.p1 GENE.GHVT01006212.1~~GHVT01006212.1.p1  ORF type:complete len:575 (-),score=106.12 GHVT01006212.1:5882-7606(-)